MKSKKILYLQDCFSLGGINKISSVKESWLAAHGYEIHNLNMLEEECISSEGMYSKQIRRHFIYKEKLNKLHAIPLIGRLLRYLYVRIKYLKILYEVRPDIIISTQPPLEPLSVICLTFWKKRILECHGWYNFYSKKDLSLRDCWYAITKYRIYHVVCLTKREAKHLEKLFGCQAEFIPNAQFVEPLIPSNCQAKHVLSLARFSSQKNLIGFLPAWKKIQCKHPDWSLELYGEGGDRPEMERIIKSEKLTSVHIHSYTTDVAKAYLESSIYVLPSCYEGFPLVLLESMSYGVPVVAYNCPCGPAEIICNGEDGFVTEYDNPDDMVDKINYLIENEDVRIKMGRKAIQNVKRFDLDEIMGKWVSLFDKL